MNKQLCLNCQALDSQNKKLKGALREIQRKMPNAHQMCFKDNLIGFVQTIDTMITKALAPDEPVCGTCQGKDSGFSPYPCPTCGGKR